MSYSTLHEEHLKEAFYGMMDTIHPKTVAIRGATHFFDYLPTGLLIVAIVVVGFIISCILYRVIMCMFMGCRWRYSYKIQKGFKPNGDVYTIDLRDKTGDRNEITPAVYRSQRYVPNMVNVPTGGRSSIAHLLALSVKTAVIVMTVYIAFYAMNIPFSVLISVGVVGIIVTYSLSTIIKNGMAAMIIFYGGRYTEDQFLSINGVEGRLDDMDSQFIYLRNTDKKGNVIFHQVPMHYMTDYTVSMFITRKGYDENIVTPNSERRLYVGKTRRRVRVPRNVASAELSTSSQSKLD